LVFTFISCDLSQNPNTNDNGNNNDNNDEGDQHHINESELEKIFYTIASSCDGYPITVERFHPGEKIQLII
jgi:hypothetical protein